MVNSIEILENMIHDESVRLLFLNKGSTDTKETENNRASTTFYEFAVMPYEDGDIIIKPISFPFLVNG
ncbi:MAG: hypothetical protein RIF46_03020, partial [Cyclobacteriaceae bacterium]